MVLMHVGKVLVWGQQSGRWWVNGRAGVAVCVVEEIRDLAVIQDQGLGRVVGVRARDCPRLGGGYVSKNPSLTLPVPGLSSIVYRPKKQHSVAVLIAAESVLVWSGQTPVTGVTGMLWTTYLDAVFAIANDSIDRGNPATGKMRNKAAVKTNMMVSCWIGVRRGHGEKVLV